jgi:hypothetical protein
MKIEVEIDENPYDLPIEGLFEMAARINKKRSFLFVSKILGKHIPVEPMKALLTGALLAQRYIETVKGIEVEQQGNLLSFFHKDVRNFLARPIIGEEFNPVIIGFAETATALGHAFFDAFQCADFFHTTREELLNREPVIKFEEEHSHATSHRCYVSEDIIQNKREVILVDDELTTGRTALNIIRDIQSIFPREKYSIVSILDWRSQADRNAFAAVEKELGITIQCVSLLSGTFKLEGNSPLEGNEQTEQKTELSAITPEVIQLQKIFPALYSTHQDTSVSLAGEENRTPYLTETGRFGLNAGNKEQIGIRLKDTAEYLASTRSGGKSLCLGTGEFMYIPMKIASEMGEGVLYQSTTRSPIHIQNRPKYGAKYGLSFPNPEDLIIPHFVYNIPPCGYDDVFLFFEREVSLEKLQPMLNELSKLGISDIKVVFFTGNDWSEQGE